MEQWILSLNAALWGLPMIAALFGTHIFLTLRLHGVQRYIRQAIRLTFSKKSGGTGDVSPFSALMTGLAATIGTGNIVGVATAVTAGGPGAVFWMWISGIFGMATKYTEALLSVKYRVKMPDGTMAGGPMYVMERALGAKRLGQFFAAATAVAALGIGAMVQSNSIAALFDGNFGVPPAVSGAFVAVLAGCVILGGIRSIAKVCNLLIPAAGLLFIGSNLVILALGWRTLPHTFALILTSAFCPQAAVGGVAGTSVKSALRFGIARGLFSNEAGMGSSPIVDAAAKGSSPVRQALVSYSGTFWDTVVLAALTGIMLVNSGLAQGGGLTGGVLTSAVFAVIPVVGPSVLTLSLLAFAFATIIGWSYYAEKSVEYLFGRRGVLPYKALYLVLTFLGSVFSLEAVWAFSDAANALMAIPNLATLLLLSGEAARQTRAELGSGRLFEQEGLTKRRAFSGSHRPSRPRRK